MNTSTKFISINWCKKPFYNYKTKINKLFYIIDLRNPDEIIKSNIFVKNARNIPMDDFLYGLNMTNYQFKKTFKFDKYNKDNYIVLFCKSGMRSRRALFFMESYGYQNIYNIKHGIQKF